VFRFAGLIAGFSTTVSATIGVTTLTLAGYSHVEDFRTVWTTWWLGDCTGAFVVAPFVVLWRTRGWISLSPARLAEAALLTLSLIVAGLVVFGGVFPDGAKNIPLEFLCMPLLLWAAFRFNQRKTSTAVFVLSVLAVWGTLRGYGPFVRPTQNESLLLLQAFMSSTAIMGLALAGVVAEHRRALEQLRLLAVTDPHTGLANYRKLIDVLHAEVRRSQRTGRSFSVLFLDMDGLKRINDRHGHLVGTLALRRVADALRATCRALDTPARFGGDEFAVVLPETEDTGALQVARRVSERIAADGGTPALSVSAGVARYPQDGTTAEMLLASADSALYKAKAEYAHTPPARLHPNGEFAR
jgi:diguanylate cyclase (GGDEF)-like protein